MTVLKGQGVDLSSALNCINHSSGKSSMSENIMAQRVLNREFTRPLHWIYYRKILALLWSWYSNSNWIYQ
jgi:hypothetical protein